MKAFLEQYGIAIFTIIILGIMVLMANGVGLTVEDLLKGEIKRFVTTAGEESWDSTNSKEELKVNEYGFYFDQPYVTNWDGGDFRDCIIFKENGEINWYTEISKKNFNEYKEDWCEDYNLDPDTTTLGDINQKLKENPNDIYTNVIYDKLYAEDSDGPYYFSDDGKKFYWDEDKTEFVAKLLEPEKPKDPKPATFGEAYAIYSEDDKSLTFMRSETEPVVGETYNGKIITNVYSGFEEEEYIVDEGVNTPWNAIAPDNVLSVSFDDVIKPISTSAFFANFYSCKSIDLTNLDTSEVTNMENMFNIVGGYTDSITITGLDKLDTSKVINMNWMFSGTGFKANTIILDGIENMNVSNVKTMRGMFMQFGEYTPSISLNLSNWNVSNVTNMSNMFLRSGKNATIFNLGNLNNWNISNTTDTTNMFSGAGVEYTPPIWYN